MKKIVKNIPIQKDPTVNPNQKSYSGGPNIFTLNVKVGESSSPSIGHIENQNSNNISPSPHSKPNPSNKDQSKLFNETNIVNQIPLLKSDEIKEEQVQTVNLNKYLKENLLTLRDLENHPHQFNFFEKSFQFLTVQISNVKIIPKDMQMPYSKEYPIIKELQPIDKQLEKMEDDKIEFKQFIFYKSKSGQKFVLKRSSFNISLNDQNDGNFTKLMNHYIPEKYLEYSLSKLYSASPHGVLVYFFNIIFLQNYPYTVTEMLMEDGGTQLTEYCFLKFPAVDRPQRIYEFFIQMNDCLAFLEQFRIEHNDIKLDNILENELNGTLLYKLIDFDIGKNQSVTCKIGSGMGLKGYSNEYVAPEIIQTKNTLNNLDSTQVNPWKAQIYSLGIMILKLIGFFHYNFEMGFKIDDIKKSELEHSTLLNCLNDYNNQLTDKLTKNIITICEKCIEYDPIKRPSSSDLSYLLKGLTTKNRDTINEEFIEVQKKSVRLSLNESIKTCKDQSTQASNDNNKDLNEQKALNNANSKIIDQLKNQIQFMQEENLRIKLDIQELTQQNQVSEEKVRKLEDTLLERSKKIESDNNELKHSLEDPEILLKTLISRIEIKSNTKTDIENISIFLSNLKNKKYSYRVFLRDESKMKIDNTLMKHNLFIVNSGNFLNIQVKFQYTFANPLDELKRLVDCFYTLGFHKNKNIITVKELADNLDFGQIQTKMKEFYSKKLVILQIEIYRKFKENIIENSGVPKHFIGELKYGVPQNLGNLIYENGAIYQTEFSDGKIVNYCLISKGNNLYLGLFDPISFSGLGCCLTIDPKKNFVKEEMDLHFGYFNNLRPEGYGKKKIIKPLIYNEEKKILIDNSGFYNGNWFNGLRSGQGTFIYNDGRLLTGEWRLDQMNGEGKFVERNHKAYYIGKFENGDWKIGQYYYSDGSVYIGEWEEFKRNGKGKLSYNNNKYYTGDFRNNKMHGTGEIHYENGSNYIGEFKDDDKHGKGKYSNPNYNLYEEGYYENDELNGEGKQINGLGETYTGSFKDGKFEGKGKIVYPDNSYYEGEFGKNKKNGQGMEVSKTGVIKKGEWEDGEFIC